MYKCYSDAYGNMPCDNGCLCDRCMYEDVEKIIECIFIDDDEDEEV